MDAASLQTLIQLTLFVATLGGLLLNYRKSRSDERGAVHLILREDYDRLIADRADLRAQLEACQKRYADELTELHEQIQNRDAAIRARDLENERLTRSLAVFLR